MLFKTKNSALIAAFAFALALAALVFAVAPSVLINSPNGSKYYDINSNPLITVDFNISDPENDDLRVQLYYSPVQGDYNFFIVDANLAPFKNAIPKKGIPRDQNLMGYWRFNQADGNALDSSGLGKTLGIIGSQPLASDVNYGYKQGYDGNAFRWGRDLNYMQTALYTQDFNKITMCAWAKNPLTGSGGAFLTPVTYLGIQGDNAIGLGVETTLTDSFKFSFAEGLAGSAFTGTTEIPVNTWAHACFSFDNPMRLGKLYVNGKFELQGTLDENLTLVDKRFNSGANCCGSLGTNSGLMVDDIVAYNRVLTHEEIKRIYKNGEGVYFKLDENSGTSTFDRIHDLNGVLKGSPAFVSSDFNRRKTSLDFSGVDAQDFVRIDQNAKVQFDQNFSMMWRMRPDSVSASANLILVNYDATDDNGFYVAVDRNSSGGFPSITTYQLEFATVNSTTSSSNITNPIGSWNHYAVVSNDSNVRFYVNGELHSVQGGNGFHPNTHDIMTIGGSPYGFTAAEFDGKIDEVILLQRVLSDQDIRNYYLQSYWTQCSDANFAEQSNCVYDWNALQSKVNVHDVNLIYYWPFDSFSGKNFSRSSAKGKDIAQADLFGFDHNSASGLNKGFVNNALRFDGVNDSGYVSEADIGDAKFKDFSICSWINFDSTASDTNHPVVGLGGDMEAGFHLANSGGTVTLGIRSSVDVAVGGSTTLSSGTWYNVCVTHVGSPTNRTILYLNGAVDANKSQQVAITSAELGLAIAPNGGSVYDGFIDEVLIYSRVLTPSEVSSLYTQITDGNYFIDGNVSDSGNLSGTDSGNASFILAGVSEDLQNPVVSIVSPSSGSQISGLSVTVQYSGSDTGSGIKNYLVSEDGVNFTDKGLVTSHVFSISSGIELPATRTFYVKAVNNVGFVSAVKSVTVFFVSGSAAIGVSCADVSGFICSASQKCPTAFVGVDDSDACCSVQCVGKLPDLGIESFNPVIENNVLASFSVAVRNSGEVDSGAFYVEVRKNAVDGILWGSVFSEGLGVNEFKEFSVTRGTAGFSGKGKEVVSAFFAEGTVYFAVIRFVDGVSEYSVADNVLSVSLPFGVLDEIVVEEPVVKRVGKAQVGFFEELFLGEAQVFVVLNFEGNPLRNARIDVLGLLSGFTDERGRFRFSADRQGSFDFRIAVDGEEFFSGSFSVKSVHLVLEKDFTGVGELQRIKVLDSRLKPVSGARIIVVFPSGKTEEFVSPASGVIDFVPLESGVYSVRVSKGKSFDSREFSALTFADVAQTAVISSLETALGSEAVRAPLLLSLLLIFSFVSAVVSFAVFRKFFKAVDFRIYALSLLFFFLPLLVARFFYVQFGVILALIELLAVLAFYYGLKHKKQGFLMHKTA